MTPDEHAAIIDEVINLALTKFGKTVTRTQEKLLEQLQLLLRRLELDKEGNIKQNVANRKLLTKLEGYFKKALKDSDYVGGLNEIPKAVTNITAETATYFSFLKSGFTIDAQYVKSLQRQTLSQIESLLANEGLELALKKPIIEILTQNISTGGSYNDLLRQIKEFTTGNAEVQGKLQQYAGQITSDALFNYARALQTAISSAARLQFFLYLGGLGNDSRDFCIERAGQYFHQKEIERWAKEEWAGKRRGTTASTIYIYAGGYRCQHQIIAVSETIVPPSVIQRAVDEGFYKFS